MHSARRHVRSHGQAISWALAQLFLLILAVSHGKKGPACEDINNQTSLSFQSDLFNMFQGFSQSSSFLADKKTCFRMKLMTSTHPSTRLACHVSRGQIRMSSARVLGCALFWEEPMDLWTSERLVYVYITGTHGYSIM